MQPLELEEQKGAAAAAASSSSSVALAAPINPAYRTGKEEEKKGGECHESAHRVGLCLVRGRHVDLRLIRAPLLLLLPRLDNLPWVEKYRPTALDELISHADIIHTVTKLIDGNQLPHLLFYGPVRGARIGRHTGRGARSGS